MTDTNKAEYLEIFNAINFSLIKDHPNILIAAGFWEKERFQAAKHCYALMREVDDLIDNYKSTNKQIAPDERNGFKVLVNNWLEMIGASQKGNRADSGLPEPFRRFSIPVWTMEAFARAMLYDVDHDGFATLNDFLDYSGGASVAPASVFVHLAGLTKSNGVFLPPAFDVKEVSSPCAIFSYLVHIIRDFQKDQLNNLNYFADDLVGRYGLTRQDLLAFAEGRPVTPAFRELIGFYHHLAGQYREETFKVLERIGPLVEPRYHLSLEIIFDLYAMVFERIHPYTGSFTTEELNPTPEETRERVLKKILEFE